MTYHNAIKFIKNSPIAPPENSSPAQRITDLRATLSNPQRKLKYIRLAGNNGKTVCARMLISILNSAGITNGCLSMPIYSEIRDNVRINGEPITMEETVSYVEQICQAVNRMNKGKSEEELFRPTQNEIMLCIAMLAFMEHDCELCLLESDHSGNDPSKFIYLPIAAVICGKIPADDKEEIAKIRAYISRGIQEIVSIPQDTESFKIISDICANAGCRFTVPARTNFNITRLGLRNTEFNYKDNEYSLRLCGKFQALNALVAIEACEMLVRAGYNIEREHVRLGLSTATAPCKFEVISVSPAIIADSTHSAIAISTICDSLSDFKAMTGTNIKLCLPAGALVSQFAEALEQRGYCIKKVSALAEADTTESHDYPFSIKLLKTVKQTVKDALAELDPEEILFISGPINFTRAIRYEMLAVLGF